MSSSSSRIFDELGKLMTDAAGVASGVRKEMDGVVKSQIERLLRDADVVTREEFEAIREMAVLAREENALLQARIEALEKAISTATASATASTPARPSKAAVQKA